MKQKEKKLLFKEMSARLPYGLVLDNDGHKCFLDGISVNRGDFRISVIENGTLRTGCVIENFKPCLFDMDGLSNAEKIELSHKRIDHLYKMKLRKLENIDSLNTFEFDCPNKKGEIRSYKLHEFYGDNEYYEWLYEHHVDFNGLIEKGLAVKADKHMYGFGNASDEDIDALIREEVPITLLTKEQFLRMKELCSDGNYVNATKYIQQTSGMSLKMSKTYYDLYKDNEYN